MAELFARAGALESPSLYVAKQNEVMERLFTVYPEEIDYRQSCLVRFATSLGLGPGCVQTRPSENNALYVEIALKYVALAFNPQMNPIHLALARLLLVDRCPLVFMERTSQIALRLCTSTLEKNSVSMRRVRTLLGSKSFNQACRWADTMHTPSIVLDIAVQTFLQSETYLDKDHAISSDCDGPSVDAEDMVGLSSESAASLKLFKAAEYHSCPTERNTNLALQLVCECIEVVPPTWRMEVIRKALRLRSDKQSNPQSIAISSEHCLKLMRIVGFPGVKRDSTDNAAIRAYLALLFSEAVRAQPANVQD
jgi:hypothetical protein